MSELAVIEPTDLERLSLDELADIANREGRQADEAVSRALDAISDGLLHAIAAGEAINAAKDRVPVGGWGDWVVRNIDYAESTVTRYARFATYKDQLLLAPGPLTTMTAVTYLKGLPAVSSKHQKLIPDEVRTAAKDMHKAGASVKEIASVLDLYQAQARRMVDPEYNKRCLESTKRWKAKRRKADAALCEKERRVERDQAAKRAGGAVSHAYANLRKVAADLGVAIRDAEDREAERHLRDAYDLLTKAEDQLVKALGVTS